MNTVLSSFAKPAPAQSNPRFMKMVSEHLDSNGSDLTQDPLVGMLGGYQTKR